MRRRLACMFGLASITCGESEPTPQPSPEPVALIDTNPAPDIVEVELAAEPATHEFLPGKPAEVWAFRDAASEDSIATIPGPMLEANLGDRVIVHFENRLPEGTTIHWHGLRVPNDADGTPVSQMIVPPGGRYDYEFVVTDAGLFWYHPHVDGEVQVERGLYAPIVIHDGVELDVAADRVFVLDDVKVESDGMLSTVTQTLDIMLGRQGNVVLVNGVADMAITSAAGSRERWRFVNAANGRYFNLELPGHRFLVIGWDGGLLPEPYETETLLITPGERYDVLIELDATPGEELALRTIYYDRGHDIPNTGPDDLVTISIDGEGPAPAALPESWGEVTAIPFDAATPRRSFVLREVEEVGAEPIFTINDEAFPDITPVLGAVDDIEVWEIDNQSEMDHPFHLHGMSFQVLDDAGVSVPRLGWKDTLNVPQDQTLRFVVRFGGEGRWMYHCHILEHAERGMMGELMVSP